MSSETISMPYEQSEVSVDSCQQSNGQKRKREGPYRGPGRALKYKKLRRRSKTTKFKIDIPEQLGAAVGDRALQFVAECGAWVKEICPLDIEKWGDMPKDVTDRLYGKIRDNYELPEGDHVKKALKSQCSNLYRHWRERLKKKYFSNNTCLRDVENNCPPEIDREQWKWLVYNYWNSPKQRERSEKNRANALSLKFYSACGSKSTARIIHEIDDKSKRFETAQVSSTNSDGDIEVNFSTEPKYIQLWIKTKRHANGKLDEEAKVILRKFQELHLKEIEDKGSDNLTIDEAYQIVLGCSSSYARGLGRGHPTPPSKKAKMESSELKDELEQLREREKELQAEIERMHAISQRKEQEALEREKKREEAAKEREAQLRAEFMTELAQFSKMFTKFAGASTGS